MTRQQKHVDRSITTSLRTVWMGQANVESRVKCFGSTCFAPTFYICFAVQSLHLLLVSSSVSAVSGAFCIGFQGGRYSHHFHLVSSGMNFISMFMKYWESSVLTVDGEDPLSAASRHPILSRETKLIFMCGGKSRQYARFSPSRFRCVRHLPPTRHVHAHSCCEWTKKVNPVQYRKHCHNRYQVVLLSVS